jgi:hypothetical protein
MVTLSYIVTVDMALSVSVVVVVVWFPILLAFGDTGVK